MAFVTVDVDLEDFDTEDLVAELESRGNDAETAEEWDRLYALLVAGRNEGALTVVRLLVQEKTGRIIP